METGYCNQDFPIFLKIDPKISSQCGTKSNLQIYISGEELFKKKKFSTSCGLKWGGNIPFVMVQKESKSSV